MKKTSPILRRHVKVFHDESSTRGAVVLQYFPSRWQGNDKKL